MKAENLEHPWYCRQLWWAIGNAYHSQIIQLFLLLLPRPVTGKLALSPHMGTRVTQLVLGVTRFVSHCHFATISIFFQSPHVQLPPNKPTHMWASEQVYKYRAEASRHPKQKTKLKGLRQIVCHQYIEDTLNLVLLGHPFPNYKIFQATRSFKWELPRTAAH